jgi:hypothetical protein
MHRAKSTVLVAEWVTGKHQLTQAYVWSLAGWKKKWTHHLDKNI